MYPNCQWIIMYDFSLNISEGLVNSRDVADSIYIDLSISVLEYW